MAGKNFDISRFAATLKPVRSESDTMMEIPAADIVNNPRNFYPRPNNEAMAALMESIQANGLLEPPTVVPDEGGKYRLISGHSRMEAIRLLSAGPDGERWRTVLCRVLPSMTEDQERSAVIEANRQRVKSDALLAEEAIRLTNAYIKRREAGEELPGRIRDHVAKTLQVNATKVANVTAIKNGLKVPGIVERWKRGDIPEAAALIIARMDLEQQYRLLDWMIDKGRSYSISEVKKFNTCYNTFGKCAKTGKMCENAERIYDHDLHHGEWSGAMCCVMCLRRDTCPAACQYVEKKPAPEPEKPPLNPAVKDPRLDWKEMTPAFCGRLKALREETGLSRKEFAESIGEYPGTYSAWENASMPGCERVPKLALCLGVTTDYLYGLTDDPAPAVLPEGQMMIAGWMPGGTTPAEPGDFAGAYRLECSDDYIRKYLHWDGKAWHLMVAGAICEPAALPPIWWMRLPPLPPLPEKGEPHE